MGSTTSRSGAVFIPTTLSALRFHLYVRGQRRSGRAEAMPGEASRGLSTGRHFSAQKQNLSPETRAATAGF